MFHISANLIVAAENLEQRQKVMEKITNILFCAITLLLLVFLQAKAAPTPQQNSNAVVQNNGEIMDTANARYPYYSGYYFRPVYTVRRSEAQRRRVYVPRRRYNSDNVDRFPTIA